MNMTENKEGDSARKELVHNIIIGFILVIAIIPFALLMSDKMVVGYGVDDDTIASRIVLVFGTLIIIIYSVIILLLKIIIHFLKSDSEKALIESTQKVTGHWYKWLVAALLIFIIVILFLKMSKI